MLLPFSTFFHCSPLKRKLPEIHRSIYGMSNFFSHPYCTVLYLLVHLYSKSSNSRKSRYASTKSHQSPSSLRVFLVKIFNVFSTFQLIISVLYHFVRFAKFLSSKKLISNISFASHLPTLLLSSPLLL